MNSKTGLSALAIAGLAIGAFAMQAGAASGASTSTGCRTTPPATHVGNTGAGHDKAVTNDTKKAAKDAASKRHARKIASDLLTLKAHAKSDKTGRGGATVTTPDPATGAPTVSTANGSNSDSPFLDLGGRTNTTSATGGTASAPPTDSRVIGRSSYLGSLLHVKARANAGR